jgi:hypothetical protein
MEQGERRMSKEELKPIDVSKYTVTESGNVIKDIKDNLKQEARQKALEWNGEKINGKYNRPPIANWSCYEKGYLAGAEPREKQIQIDAEQIRALQKQNGELTDRVQELEAQIEKMKCCANCKHSRTEYEHCKTDKHEKWEKKEND